MLSAIPELVLGYHVAVVSFDGGPYVASSHEFADGWKQFGEVATSPRLTLGAEAQAQNARRSGALVPA